MSALTKGGELHDSIQKVSELIRRRQISPVEVTRDCLTRVEKLNPLLNAFITVMADSAMAQAGAAEAEIQRGEWRGRLHGIPIGLKDIVDTTGVRTTAASALFKDRVPRADAEVVRRLKEAGAILIGKQNLHEFAYGGSSMVSYFGEVHNPWDLGYVAGGSSGGSAAAVAARLGFGAIGTDTGGSVRLPGAVCGVVGLKPTYGRVSARGVIALAWTLDHIGPITNRVVDAAIMLQAIAGYDAKEVTSANQPVRDYISVLDEDTKKLRVGVPREFFFKDLDAEVARAVEQALSVISGLTAQIDEVAIQGVMDNTVQTAEAYALHAKTIAESPDLYHPETLRRLRTGERISAPEYIARRRQLEEARRSIAEVFESVDVLISPTVPVATPSIAELKAKPDQLRPREVGMLRNTRPINFWGLPGISVPCGFTAAGLPIGLQIIGPHWREDIVLQLAHAYEQATEWHKCRPKMMDRA